VTRPLSIVHTENSCGWGGQEIRILTESRGLLDRGHRVQLLAPPEAPIVEAARRMGIPVETLALREKRLADFLALRRWLGANAAGIDILNTHSSTDSWLGALACASLNDPPPIVRTRHVSTPVHDRIGTRWLYRRGNAHIVTTGEAVKRQLVEGIGVPAEKMTSIPTGIDLVRFVPADPATARERLGLPPRLTVGIVATLRRWKGHAILFDALAATRDAWTGWQLLVVGGGPDREELEQYVRGLGLADLVRFTGHQEDVVPWIQSLDLFVTDGAAQADAVDVVHGHQNGRFVGNHPQMIETAGCTEDGFGFDALDDAESVVWVNDLVTDFECHVSPTE